MVRKTRVSIPWATERLGYLRESVRDFLSEFDVPHTATQEIVLGVDEAVSNVLLHAGGGNGSKEVHVDITLEKEDVQVTVTSPGPYFDPTVFPDPDIEDCMKRGSRPALGIALMRKIFDEMTYLCVHEGTNHLVLTKGLAAPVEAAEARILPV
jgi:anti-sigma regulatory factor (Ser/Thr protein kinase)